MATNEDKLQRLKRERVTEARVVEKQGQVVDKLFAEMEKNHTDKLEREWFDQSQTFQVMEANLNDLEDEIADLERKVRESTGRAFVRNEQALEDLETKSLGLPVAKAVTGSIAEQIEDLEDAAKDQSQLAAGNEALAKENRATADDQMQLAKGHEALAKENRATAKDQLQLAKGHEALAKENRQQAKDWQREADQLKRQ